MEDTNVAAPQGEAAPLTSNSEPAPAPEVPATPESTPIFTNEQALEIKNFLDNHGGLEKIKKNLSMRQADMQTQAQTTQPNPLNDSISQQLPATAQPPQSIPQSIQGGMTQEEFAIQQYFTSLAGQEQYKNIADQMRSGEVLKEMAKFDIQPMVNGVFNDQKVRNFLDLYSKSVPAVEPAAPLTNTPTVEYVEVPETISTMEQAMQILKQDQELKTQGKAGHPRAKEANEFFDGVLNLQQNRGKKEHKTLEQAQAK